MVRVRVRFMLFYPYGYLAHHPGSSFQDTPIRPFPSVRILPGVRSRVRVRVRVRIRVRVRVSET